MISIDDYSIQKDNIKYKDETYSVRDNGAILRYPKTDKIRPNDNKWTFGKPNKKTGYMDFGCERVHRIVAKAFLGEPPTPQHVVDHIDTNRQNNRPENLRWLTKLENTLLNTYTYRKIVFLCGSVEAFLENPKNFYDRLGDTDVSWMRSVTKEEAANCLMHFEAWSKHDEEEYVYTDSSTHTSSHIGEWIFERQKGFLPHQQNSTTINESNQSLGTDQELPLIESLTPNCLQNWYQPTEFLCCPTDDLSLEHYYNNIKPDKIFSKNKYCVLKTIKCALCDNFIAVLCLNEEEQPIKPYILSKIEFNNGVFYHYNEHSFFHEDGAEKYYTLLQGLKWTGGDVFDDYC